MSKQRGRLPFSFNTQPPEGGWVDVSTINNWKNVSTHSRLKAAGSRRVLKFRASAVSTHSRLKAAGPVDDTLFATLKVSTHSRLKAAGYSIKFN